MAADKVQERRHPAYTVFGPTAPSAHLASHGSLSRASWWHLCCGKDARLLHCIHPTASSSGLAYSYQVHLGLSPPTAAVHYLEEQGLLSSESKAHVSLLEQSRKECRKFSEPAFALALTLSTEQPALSTKHQVKGDTG